MAWLVLSTSSLMNVRSFDVADADVTQDKLESLVRRSGYKPVTLQNIMRNSANITSATSPDSLIKYRGVNIKKSISSGSCSTVTGTRPTCYLYKYSYHIVNYENYEVLARCANKYLKNKRSKETVILCDRLISPRQMKPLLTGDVTLYDAGVEQFDLYNTPYHYSADIDRQREQLKTWINSGGVLLTHKDMFRGCEAETIVFLVQRWGGVVGDNQVRSGPTRAVSQLCVVTSDYWIEPEEIKQNFNVIDVRGDQGVVQSGKGEETNIDTDTD